MAEVHYKSRARVPSPKISRPVKNNTDKTYLSNLPALYKLRRFYLSKEVAAHNTADDCWVSLFNQVYDLTKLIAENSASPLCDPIVLAAGSDISHWFNPINREPKKFVDSATNMETYYTPTGRYLHIPSTSASSDAQSEVAPFKIPWWFNSEEYMIGRLTKKVRQINIMNTLTKEEVILDVCSEENMNEILDRYMLNNFHAASYTWKRLGKCLDMKMTLAENGIPDDTKECLMLGIDPEEYIPTIHLYFDDDLTIQ